VATPQPLLGQSLGILAVSCDVPPLTNEFGVKRLLPKRVDVDNHHTANMRSPHVQLNCPDKEIIHLLFRLPFHSTLVFPYTADRGQYKIIAYVLALSYLEYFNGYVIAAYSSPYLEFYNTFAGMSYLDEMLNNRKA
jgi:hypothetical protein